MTTTTMQNLPKDLVEEILCRVSATHLKRLRSTCKTWNFLFNDKSFARKHCDKAAKQFLFLMLTKDYMICLMRVDLHGTFPSVKVKRMLTLPDPKYNNSYQFVISRVFHCDGLLLCTSESEDEDLRAVVWNPCTGQTKWLQPINRSKKGHTLVLGYKQDNESCNKSYKILSFDRYGAEIYEFSSDSWRVLDDGFHRGWNVGYSDHCVSLKGHAYMFATDETKRPHFCLSLLRFDFRTEKSELVPLPYEQDVYYEATGLSVVREEKLSVLLMLYDTSKTEIWVTNKIGAETKVVSWSKVLALELSRDLQISHLGSFLLEEEKKVI